MLLLFLIAFLVLMIVCLLFPAARAQQEHDVFVKVVAVDRSALAVEARFTVVPDDLRMICHGEARNLFVGDWVKVQFKNGKSLTLAGTKLDCDRIRWVR